MKTVSSICLSLVIAGSAIAEPVVVRNGVTGEDRLARIERMLENMRENQAQVNYKLEAMRSEVQSMRGQVEEHSFQLERLSERQRDMYRDLDRRLNQVGQGGNNSTNAVVEQNNTETNSVNSSSNNETANNTSVSEYEQYSNIFTLVRSKEYNKAIQSYQKFIQDHPNSQYAFGAQYWIGQMFNAQRKLDLAFYAFQTVVEKYPTSKRAPEALLKMASIRLEQNNVDEAKRFYQQVIRDYAESSSAKSAQSKLQSL